MEQKKVKIEGTIHDRRRKLTPEQELEIIANVDDLSIRKLAQNYGVSRRTIQFLQDPEKRMENLKRREERGGSSIYYVKEEHMKTVRKHREYKNDLIEKGEI